MKEFKDFDGKKVFPIYANALAERVGFKFRFANVPTASCGVLADGTKVITIPQLPMLMDEDSLAMYLGLNAHEMERYNDTDLGFMAKANAVHALAGELLNVYEDIRIERNFGLKFMGGRKIINDMAAALAKRGFYGHPTPKTQPASILTQFILHRLNVDLLGQPLREFADSWEAAFEAVFSPLVKYQIRAVMAKAKDMRSTECAYNLALETLNVIADASKAQENEQKEKEQPEGSQSPQTDKGESSQGGSDNQEGKNSEQNQQSESSEASSEEPSQQYDLAAADAMQASRSDFDQQDKSELLSAKNISNDGIGPMSPITTENGSLFDGGRRTFWIQKARMRSNGMIQQLTALLQNQDAMGGKRRAASGKRISNRALVPVLAGNNTGLYTKKAKGQDTFADVHILIDCSSSMSGNPIETAMQSAMSLMMALDSIDNVTVDCSAFTNWGGANHHKVTGKTLEEKMLKLCSLNKDCMMGTPTHDGILGAVSMMNLDKHSDKRVLFVLQDGGGSSIPEAVKIANSQGIHVVGIGINCDISHYYKNSVMIKDVAELPSKLFELMRSELVAA